MSKLRANVVDPLPGERIEVFLILFTRFIRSLQKHRPFPSEKPWFPPVSLWQKNDSTL